MRRSVTQPLLRSLDHDRRAEMIPFQYMPVLLGGKRISHVRVRHAWPAKTTGIEPQPAKVAPKSQRLSALGTPLGVWAHPLVYGHTPWCSTLLRALFCRFLHNSRWSGLRVSDPGGSRKSLHRGREHPLPQGAPKVVGGGDGLSPSPLHQAP
jgi:hypothetical protein